MMRHPRALVAVRLALTTGALALFGFAAWSCTTLTDDCALNLNCPGMAVPVCNDILDPGDCDTCVQGYCCQELADCYADQECLYGCLYGFYPVDPDCSMPPSQVPFQAMVACMNTSCATACAMTDGCNPVNGSGCPDDVCDADYPGVYECAVNDGTLSKLCEACDNVNSPYCGAGLHCYPSSSTCARFCCTDADCGTGRCELDQTKAFGGPVPLSKEVVGLCVTMDGMGAACDAPAVPPSGGSCAQQFN
jgi:hypothetical protein